LIGIAMSSNQSYKW